MEVEVTYLNLDILIILIHSMVKLAVARSIHHVSVALRSSYLITNDQASDTGLNLNDASQLLCRQPLSYHLRIIQGTTFGISAVSVPLVICCFFRATSISHSFQD